MKNFRAVFALFCVMFLFAACSGNSKESVYGDTDTSDSTSDKTDSDTTDTNSDDADSQSDSTADTTPDNGDSADDSESDKPDSDNPDTTPDGGNTASDNGDSADDADTSDSGNDSGDSQSDEDADTSDSKPEHETGETREADCNGLPANASWNTVSSITQTWNGNEWTPSTEAVFSTTSSSTKCRFVCNQNYEWNDSECVAGTRTANCEGLPEHAVWNGAASITQTWDDENWVPSNIGTYNKTPNSSECRFQCAVNYNWTGSQCVAATIQSDCTGLPDNALWNTVSNITQSWSGTAWTPSEIGTFNETPSYSECHFVCKTNYSWNNIVCAPDELHAVACTGKPDNAVWNSVSNITQTWNGNEWAPTTSATFNETPSTTECRFKCAENYEWNDAQCAAKTREANCTGLPTNAEWNTATKIMQTWSGNAWIPSNTGSFNSSASQSECYFKCKEHYTWNDTICEADTQPATCKGLPENAVWNSVSEITQTWNGNGWIPSNVGTFNASASVAECRFKCKDHYSWNSSTSKCVADSQPATCIGLPTNASWNTASSITQTWDGNAWIPSNAGTYDETPSSNECHFKCNQHYTWNSSTSTCVADTQPANCLGLPTNAVWNTASSITQTWNGKAWTPSNTGTYDETPSSNECHYKCSSGYHTEDGGISCVSNTRTNVACTGLPENAEWNTTSTITQTWNGNTWIPAATGSFSATPSSAECKFKCNEHYTWNPSTLECAADTKSEACTGLPDNAQWNTVSSITQTWNGNAWAPSPTGVYNKTATDSECHFVCIENYDWDSLTKRCVTEGDTRVVNCSNIPAHASYNTVSSITQTYTLIDGGCEESSLSWEPSKTSTYDETPSETECHYKCDNGYQYDGTSMCVITGDTKLAFCTGLPANAEWNTVSSITQTWNGSSWTPTTSGTYNETAITTQCRYKCKSGYTWDGSSRCLGVGDTKTASCTGLPANTQWNTASSITQTWNGNSWTPSTTGTYNETASTEECRFKCNTNYNWNNSSKTCVAATQTVNCTGLPENAEWNTASTITQTWNGNSWIPSNTGSYNASANIAECRFKCKEHYTWNPSTSICVADTQSANCTGLPTNAEWNTVSTITQTWDGNAWTPSNVGTYNITQSLTECRFECKTNYNWNSSTSKCNAATRSTKCTKLPANASWCGSSTITQTWNGSEWTPTNTSPSSCVSGNAGCESNRCWCRCDSGYAWMVSSGVGSCHKLSKSTDLPEIFSKTCTGQNKCYNGTEEIECPVESNDFFGQDAYYANQNSCTPQNFEIENISNDNVVADTNTGLQWQQTIPEQTYNWDDAKTYCEELTYADYSDWRLPSPKEFLTIVDNSKYSPAIDSTYFMNMPNDGYFWTSEEYNYSDSNSPEPSAYYFGTYFGNISSNAKTEAANVMCVRGNKLPKSTLEIEKIEEEEIVSDSATELIWQKSYATDKNWPEALSYCENLKYAGYSDWRLPNKNELSSLVKYGEHNPASDFQNMPTNTFWTSTTTAEIKDSAWSIDFYSGYVATTENKSTTNYVRCVRNE